MRESISNFIWGVIAVYLIVSQFFVIYFMYDFSRTHDFVETVLAGIFVSEFKAIFFPLFI